MVTNCFSFYIKFIGHFVLFTRFIFDNFTFSILINHCYFKDLNFKLVCWHFHFWRYQMIAKFRWLNYRSDQVGCLKHCKFLNLLLINTESKLFVVGL